MLTDLSFRQCAILWKGTRVVWTEGRLDMRIVYKRFSEQDVRQCLWQTFSCLSTVPASPLYFSQTRIRRWSLKIYF